MQKISCDLQEYDTASQEYIISFIKEIENKYFKEDKPSIYKNNIKYVDFMLTNKCNLNCIHCSSRCDNNNKQKLSSSKIYEVLDKLSDSNLEQLVLTGGEHLMVDEIEKILEYARNKLVGTRIILSTNGTLIDKYVDSIIRNIDIVNISIDGYSEEMTKKIRGKGVFEKILNGIKLLQDRGFTNIKTSMVLLENNKKEMEKFIKFNKDLKTEYIFRMLCNVGRAKDNKEYFRKKDFSGYPVANYLLTSGISDKKQLNIRACNTYNNKIYINHDGKIYPCPSLKIEDFQIGDIVDVNFTFKNLLNKMNNMKNSFFNIDSFFSNSKCKICSNKIFCWTCPADFIIARKNHDINELCNVMKERIEKLFI